MKTSIQIIYPTLTEQDFRSVIRLQDDGDGVYIKEWRHLTLPQPRQEQLDAVAAQAVEVDSAAQASIEARKVWPSVTEFYAEFTPTEKYLIQSSTIPSIVVARGDLAMWRGEVWGEHTDVLSGLDAMVEVGILTTERKAEILTK